MCGTSTYNNRVFTFWQIPSNYNASLNVNSSHLLAIAKDQHR